MKHQKKSNIYQEFIKMCYLIAKRKFRDFLIVIYHHEPLNDDQPEKIPLCGSQKHSMFI